MGGESSLVLVFLDFVECCFKKRARAGRGRGASRLCCFTFTSDGASSFCWWSESTEEFWDTAVLTLSLQFKEFKRTHSLSVLIFFFVTTVSPFFAGDVSLFLETSCPLLFKAVDLVLVCSVLQEVLSLMPSCSRLHLCSET